MAQNVSLNAIQEEVSARHTRNNGDVINFADYLKRTNTPFNAFQIAEKRSQNIYSPVYPLSDFRDKITTSSNGSVTNSTSEYLVKAATDNNSEAILDTAYRGNYKPGQLFEAGIGIRVPVRPTGDAKVEAGYFHSNEGFFIREESDGIKLVRRRGGTDKNVIPQSEWNGDRLDGSGKTQNPSKENLDLSNGIIFEVQFLYYGYGPIYFSIGRYDEYLNFKMDTVHVLRVEEETSINESNLPVRALSNSGTTGTELDLMVGGRQTSSYGPSEFKDRVNGERRTSISIGTTIIPIISFRIKDGFEAIPLFINSLDILTDTNTILELRANGSLTGASFGTPTNTMASESATEWDSSATAISGGTNLFSRGVTGGQGNQTAGINGELPDIQIPEDTIVTLAAGTTSGTGTMQLAILKATERW